MNIKLIVSTVLLFTWLGQVNADALTDGTKKKPKRVGNFTLPTEVTPPTPPSELDIVSVQEVINDNLPPVGVVEIPPPQQPVSSEAPTTASPPQDTSKTASQQELVEDPTAAAPIINGDQDITNDSKTAGLTAPVPSPTT